MNYYMYPFSQSFGVGGMHSLPVGIAPFLLGALAIVLVWSFIWKGLALWNSARNHQKAWFVILLIVNTLGILEIIYLLFFRKNQNANISTTTVVHTTTTVPPVVPPVASDSSAPVV